MKQKIKFVKRFMSVVVAATMVFAMVTGIGDFFPNIKSEAAARQTLYICDIKSGGFSANYAGYTRLSIDRNAGNVNRGCGKGSNDYIWVKTTTDPAQAYTRIWSVWQNNSGTSSSLDGYSVERKTGDLNDGVGSKSGYIYVYATKDRKIQSHHLVSGIPMIENCSMPEETQEAVLQVNISRRLTATGTRLMEISIKMPEVHIFIFIVREHLM